MGLHIKLFGLLSITEEDGAPSALMKRQKGCALLAYLIVTGKPQRREHLADLLWDAPSTAQSLHSLRTLLSRIRPWLPNLSVSRTQIAYTPETAAAVDYLVLTEALAAGRVAEMDAALSLYEGDLLPGFYVDDAPRFNEWLLVERERLRQRVTAAYRQICLAYSEEEAWARGILAAQRWLAHDEFDEEALRTLLQFLAASGQVAVALQQYETSRQRLWQELEIEPALETVQLVQRLQALREVKGGGLSWSAIVGAQVERPSLDQLSEPGALPHTAYVPYQRNNDFTGRQESLLRLANLLLPDSEKDKQRAVAITGMGGLGKTQLAVEFCYRYGRYFPGGVFWLSFANESNIAQEVVNIGGERGMGLFSGAEKLTLIDQVRRVRRAWQETVPRLLIFDNCEEEHLLTEWLPVTGGCRVLLTSRRGVWTPEVGTKVHALTPLDRPESVQFLQQMVANLEETAADEIAEETGNLPLALYLAGSFLRRYPQITTEAYLQQLRHRGLLQHPSLQGRGATHSPTGHELDIARTFTLNFAQLNPEDETDLMAQKLLACAIAFAHGEPIPQQLLLACLQTEADDFLASLLAMDGLTRLLSMGLLKSVSGESVQIHRLVAEYAAAELDELQMVGRTAVENHLLQLVTERFVQTRFLGHLPFAASHLQAITQKGLERNDDVGTQFGLWWGRHLRDVGALAEARVILETAVSQRRNLFPDGDLVLADLLSVLGTSMWEMGASKQAWPYYEEVAAIRQRILGQNHTLTAQSLQNLAILHSRTGSFESAKSYFEQALAIYGALEPPDEQQIAITLNNMGMLLRRMNRFAEAEQRYKEALTIRKNLLPPTSPWIAQSFNSLGYLLTQQGAVAEALAYHQQALAIRLESYGEQHTVTALSLLNLGITKGKKGDFNAAEGDLQRSLAIRQAQLSPNHPHVGQCFNYLGQHHYRAGNLEKARPFLEKAVAILAEKRPNDAETADAYIYLAYCHIKKGELDEAAYCLDKAQAIQESNLPAAHFYTAYRLLGSADLAKAQGDVETARQFFQEAVAIFGKTAVASHPDWSLFR